MMTLTDSPDPRLRTALDDGLAEHNEEMSRLRDWRCLAVAVHDPDTGALAGGCRSAILAGGALLLIQSATVA